MKLESFRKPNKKFKGKPAPRQDGSSGRANPEPEK